MAQGLSSEYKVVCKNSAPQLNSFYQCPLPPPLILWILTSGLICFFDGFPCFFSLYTTSLYLIKTYLKFQLPSSTLSYQDRPPLPPQYAKKKLRTVKVFKASQNDDFQAQGLSSEYKVARKNAAPQLNSFYQCIIPPPSFFAYYLLYSFVFLMASLAFFHCIQPIYT